VVGKLLEEQVSEAGELIDLHCQLNDSQAHKSSLHTPTRIVHENLKQFAT
jgi:hypothetical protein